MPRLLSLLCCVLFLMASATVIAQTKKPVIPKAKPKVDTSAAKKDSLNTVVKDKKKIDGLFRLYEDTTAGSLQIYVKKNQLGKEFIYQSFSMGGPASLF